MKEDILKMYFEEHMKQKDIAEILNVTSQYISKVVAKDDRYVDEKSSRHKESQRRKAEYNKEYHSTYERKYDKSSKEDYDKLKALLDSDARRMSVRSHGISKDSYVKSNLSAYTQDKNGNLVLEDNINASYALPKKYKRNVKKLYKEQVK